MNLTDALEAMIEHTNENPSHGINCVCKDRWVSAVRQSLNLSAEDAVRRQNANYLVRMLHMTIPG
jgi:hypothetical protein